MGRAHNTYWRYEKCVQILVTKLEEMRPVGRPTHRWENNIRMDLKETGSERVSWIHLTQHKDHGNEPSCSMKFK
jgi:hypothetical protein